MRSCRCCKSKSLFTAIEMGSLPIAGEFLENSIEKSDKFSSDMLICKNCMLGQISFDVDSNRIFNHYKFRTSYSKTFLKHSEVFVNKCIKNIEFDKNDWILELGSNDGYLLKIFKKHKIDVLGVDPAKNISMYALCDGVPTIVDFFSSKLAKEILRIKGYPKLIIANNVLAHVPDINDFMYGISILCNHETLVSIENPSISNILIDDEIDTIYHEHYSYLSATFMQHFAEKFNLVLFDLEKYPIHGTTNRYWIGKNKKTLESVCDEIKYESIIGINNEDIWKQHNKNIKNKVKKFRDKVLSKIDSGSIICGYAASGKASVIVSLSSLDVNSISAIADDSFEKQGRYMPGSKIPIVSPKDLLKIAPTDIIIFSWNIYEEIKQKIDKSKLNKTKVWIWDEE